MDALSGFQVHRLVSVPRPPAEEAAADPGPDQLYAAWVGAHARLRQAAETAGPAGADAACAVAWVRLPGANRLDFYLAGRPFFPPVSGDAVFYPPGARTVTAPGLDALGLTEAFPSWVGCSGQADSLWAAQPDQPRWQADLGDFAAHLRHPYAWLIIAEPCPRAEIERALAELSTRIPRLRQRENSQADRVGLHQAEDRFNELTRACSTGAWRTRVLAGGPTPAQAHQAAALLCGYSTRTALPYILIPGDSAVDLARCLDAPGPAAGGRTDPPPTGPAHERGGESVPFLATADLLAVLGSPPRRELPGIELVEPPNFDTTIGSPSPDGLPLGAVLDRALEPAEAFTVSRDTLNRHAFVCGATGSGKSQTVRTLLEALSTAPDPVPWLVIEPAKAEYARMAGRLGPVGRVLAIRPGDPDCVPGCLNPLEPEPGFPLQTHIDLIRALFQAAFEAEEPFPQVLSHAMDRAYRELGWDVVLGEPAEPGIVPRYPTLSDLRRIALEVVEDIGYGREIADNVRGFIDVRLGSLTLGTPGRFFEGGHPLDLADLLARNTVLELEDIGNDQDKAFFIGAIIIRIAEHLRRRTRDTPEPGLRHVTVIEEAHRLLKHADPGSPASHAVELFAGLLAEIRAYGEGIVVAEQIPAKIIPDVVKNTALKIMHRLPAHDDRFTVGATMNLTEEQSRYVVTLPPGQAVVFADGMDHPLLAAMAYGGARENDDDIDRSPAILRPRSSACSPTCHTEACTLREMTHGGRLARDPWLTLWIELLTVAHVVGEPAPDPDPDWLASLREGHDPRTLGCAVGQAVQRSIDTRYVSLAAHYQPESLAAHLAQHAADRLAGEPSPCDGTEVQWQSGQFRWVDVARALEKSSAETGPHPDTGQWRNRGLDLPGATCVEQLRHLERRPDSMHAQPIALGGTDAIPLYEAAAARLAGDAQPIDRLTHAAAFLNIRSDWPAGRLYPREWKERRTSDE